MRPHGVFLLAAWIITAPVFADQQTVVDVSKEWNEHASSAPITPQTTPGNVSPAGFTVTRDTEPVLSCGCESMTTAEKLRASTYAFTGTVFEVRAIKKGRRSILLDVDEIFKGSLKQETEIVTDISGGECDLKFEEGRNYLVYALWEWGSLVTSRCMGTKSIDKARGDASALGPSESMKEKLYLHLRDNCMGRDDTVCCLSSLKALRQGYYVPEPEGGCPEGTIPDRLRCAGSYTWCISNTEENHSGRKPQ